MFSRVVTIPPSEGWFLLLFSLVSCLFLTTVNFPSQIKLYEKTLMNESSLVNGFSTNLLINLKYPLRCMDIQQKHIGKGVCLCVS